MRTPDARWQWAALAGLALIVLGGEMSASADEMTSTHIDGMLTKLGRGIADIATSPLELIRTPAIVSHRAGYLAGGSIGLAQGAWRAIQRAAVGVFEVATFYAEIPPGFQPIMKPEFVWVDGNWIE